MPVSEPGKWTRQMQEAGGGPVPQSSPPSAARQTPPPASTETQGSGMDNLQQLRDLIQSLSQETTTLIQKEIQLAKAELTEKGKQAGIGAGMFGGAAVMGLLTAGAFTALLILALSLLIAPWLSALVVTLVYGAIAGALALSGKKKVQQATPLVPEQAVDAAKSTKDRLQSAWKSGS